MCLLTLVPVVSSQGTVESPFTPEGEVCGLGSCFLLGIALIYT